MVSGETRRSEGEGTAAPLLHLDRDHLFPLARALEREWLEVDGSGGYASSTIVMCPTRRQHGLLVVRPEGHARRHVFLSRFEEILHRSEREFPLSTGRYPGTWYPTGHAGLESFFLAPHPVFVYRVGRTLVTREVLLVRGLPLVLCRYRLESGRDDIELRLRPLLAFRDVDALTHENLNLQPRVERKGGGIVVRPYPALPPLAIRIVGTDASFEVDPTWYRKVEYQRDLQRGYYGHEDHFNPGWFSAPLRPGQDLLVAASLGGAPVEDPFALWDGELARRREEAKGIGSNLRGRLARAGGAFPFEDARTGRRGLEAGFPWPAESARDTLVAAPGLLLSRGDVPGLARVLEDLLPFLTDGLLPSRVGDRPESSEYEAVDPSLWLAWAVRRLEVAGGDVDPFREPLERIAEQFLEGAPLDIHVDRSGLLHAGREDLAVTWMDARVDGHPVTPRHGFAVEVNALWYHLLAMLEHLAEVRSDTAGVRRWRRMRRAAKRGFIERFWLPYDARLADVWRDGKADVSVRPNMVIAAALEWSPLTRGQRTDIVSCARAELLTPVGLRSLAPKNPDYRGHCGARPEERDGAAHQGAAWPWLLGFYGEAWLRAHGFKPKRVAALRALLTNLEPHFLDGGLLQLPEVFDGDPPHKRGGAFARAWSLAEPLRALGFVEDGVLS